MDKEEQKYDTWQCACPVCGQSMAHDSKSGVCDACNDKDQQELIKLLLDSQAELTAALVGKTRECEEYQKDRAFHFRQALRVEAVMIAFGHVDALYNLAQAEERMRGDS